MSNAIHDMPFFLRWLLLSWGVMGLAACATVAPDGSARACRPQVVTVRPVVTFGEIKLPEGVVLTPELEAEIRAQQAEWAQRLAQRYIHEPATASGCGA